MNLSIIGLLLNMIAEYDEKLRRCNELIDEQLDDYGEKDGIIADYLLNGDTMMLANRHRENSYEDTNDFFNSKTGMIAAGKELLHDLQCALKNEWDKCKMIIVDTEEAKHNLKTLAKMME